MRPAMDKIPRSRHANRYAPLREGRPQREELGRAERSVQRRFDRRHVPLAPKLGDGAGMRIRRKIQLAGLAVALAGGVSGTAEAGDRTISTGITTPVATSNPDGSGVAGDVTVTTTGSITVTTGQTAVTVNSSNDVSNSGQITSTAGQDNVNGILLQGGNTGNITNAGTISLFEDYTLADSDADGDFDGNVAIGTNRHGIFLQAGPTFTGDILNSGSISIEGNNSSGITLNGLLTGDLTSSSSIAIVGDNSFGIAINGGVSGDVLATGGGTVRGQNSAAIHVNSAIGGELAISGTWNALGYLSTIVPNDQSNLDADDLEQALAGVLVNGNVAGGITLRGSGVENDPNDDGDADSNESDDNFGAVVNMFGSAPAIHIQADGSNLTVGAGTSGYGLLIRGQATSAGLFDNIESTALRIEGDGVNTATITGGVSIDGSVTSGAAEANAQAVVFGQGGVTSLLQVRGSVLSNVSTEALDTSRGILLQAGATVPTLNNSGSIQANNFTETGDSIAIHDQSGTLTSITNSGQIIALLIPTDDDQTDDILPPAATGSAIAIDLSGTSAAITLQQIAPIAFTDDDAVDDTVATAALITGDIRLGSGSDTVNLLSGAIFGDIAFGAGADVFTLNNGATYAGSFTDTDGALTINVQNGTFNYLGGALNITSATFAAGSTFNAFLSGVPADSTNIVASGTVTFAPGAGRVTNVVARAAASG